MYAKAGRPSVDPDVFFKLQLGMFFENVRSERQLMRVVADRISVCWHLGYDLYESLPDHSSLTRIRDRYGLEIFGRFFEWIVEMYAEAGLVWGEELGSLPTSADAELVCANTARSDWISKAGRQDRKVRATSTGARRTSSSARPTPTPRP